MLFVYVIYCMLVILLNIYNYFMSWVFLVIFYGCEEIYLERCSLFIDILLVNSS